MLATLPALFKGISMLGGLTTKFANLWLGYKRSKVKTYAVEALYKNDKKSQQTKGT